MPEFKRARTEEQIAARHREIVSACSSLYLEGGFDAVNFKAISERTSVSRPALYNYYNTKEEVLLDMIQVDFDDWNDTLTSEFESQDSMTRDQFCRFITDTLSDRPLMLEFLSRHLSMLELNSRLENIVDLKIVIGKSIHSIDDALLKYFGMPDSERDLFMSLFFAFLHGLYPMSHPTEMQKKAMELAGHCVTGDFDTICYNGLLRLLGSE